MFTRANNLKVYKSNKHSHKRTKSVKNTVCDINAHVEFPNKHTSKYKDRNHINNETVTTPSSNHVKILKGASN
jgi:hypothetical protein